MFKLTAKDLKLAGELEGSFRKSISSIAKKIGVSKEVANYRLNRLISERFIKRYVTRINSRKLGYQLYRFVLNLHNIKENTRQSIIDDLKREKKTRVEVFIQTNKDIEIFFWAKNNEELESFHERIIEKHFEFIQQKEVSLITKDHYLTHAYVHGKKRASVFGAESPEKIDEGDQKIIDELTKEPSIQMVDLAKRSGMTQSTALSKLNRLYKKGIIDSINPVFDTSMIGYSRYNVDIILNSLLRKASIIEFLTQSNNITRIYEYIGRFDLGFEAHFRTTIELEDFLNKLRISGFGISDYDVTLMLA